MLSIRKSIKKSKKKYSAFYQDAIKKLWSHSNVIAGQSVENWFIAQVTQESRANPLALSPAGALGLAQFMPGTAKEVGKRLLKKGIFTESFDRRDAEQSIYAQVDYMNTLFNVWSSKRSDESRMLLALASYNAGAGNIIKAQKKANNARHWFFIKKSLRTVTGKRNSKETLGYVSNIANYALLVDDIA